MWDVVGCVVPHRYRLDMRAGGGSKITLDFIAIVTATRDCGRVTAILYSQLATRLRSLAIILPIHLFTITRVHVCNSIPIITIRMPTWPDAGVRALTLLSLFGKRIRFAHEISRVYPYSDVPHHTVYN